MLKIYTANIRYNGPDRMDVTKSFNNPLAPPWNLINDRRYRKLNEEEFSAAYRDYLFALHNELPTVFIDVLKNNKITFVCFCKPFEFCHRVVLAKFFEEVFPEFCKYIMERKKYLNGHLPNTKIWCYRPIKEY